MRTETITKEVFTFDELSDDAKQTAIGAARDWNVDHDWWDIVYDDFERICDIIGIDLDTKPIPLMNGKTRQSPKIWFSGFCSQGDGASFEGTYSYKKGASKSIREYAPNDRELHGIVDRLTAIQRKHFYGLSFGVSQSGRHCHEMTMQGYATDRDGYETDAETSGNVLDELRSLAQWLYSALESEYEWLTSDENVAENLRANECEFTSDGNLY